MPDKMSYARQDALLVLACAQAVNRIVLDHRVLNSLCSSTLLPHVSLTSRQGWFTPEICLLR